MGILTRASARARTGSGTPADFAPDENDVARTEGEVPQRRLALRRQQDEASPSPRAPSLEALEVEMPLDGKRVEVVHAGAAQAPIGEGEARRLDDRGLDPEAGAGAQHRADVLRDVGLVERQGQGSGRRRHRTLA